MLFGSRSVTPNPARPRNTSRTPNKSTIRKQMFRHDSRGPANGSINPTISNKQNKNILKSKQNMGILYSLQQIYTQLKFTQFDAFPQQRIIQARKNIQKLYNYFKEDQPICPIHEELLNLYCETQKQVVCVSCVFNNPEHKNHKVRQIQYAQKTLQYEIIRNEEKARSLANQLTIIQQQIRSMEKQMCDYFMNVSNNGVSIINQAIKELQLMKQDYDNKLSLAYRRTNTIIKRYHQCLDLMVSTLDINLHKASTMKGLSKYLILKELIKQTNLIEDLVNKYSENKALMQPWKKAVKDVEKIMVKKKIQKPFKEDVYVVTKF